MFFSGNVLSGKVLPGNVLSGKVLPGNVFSGNVLSGKVSSGNVFSGNFSGMLCQGTSSLAAFFFLGTFWPVTFSA